MGKGNKKPVKSPRRGTGLTRDQARELVRLQVPVALLYVLSWLTSLTTVTHERDLDVIEFFSGCGSLTSAMRSAGLKTSAAQCVHPRCGVSWFLSVCYSGFS
jgi:hypothetical protein